MSYHPGQPTSGLRWREDTGIEHRCSSCPRGMQWWPLTEEFWRFRSSFIHCRACLAKAKRESQRRVKNEARRLANLEYQKQYRAETKDVRRIKNQIYYWNDPDTQRAKAKARYQRNRDRILEQRRARYWAEKKAA